MARTWGRNGPCEGRTVGVCRWRRVGGQNERGGQGGEAREAAGDGVYPTDGTEITLPQREEAGTFSVALSDAVVRGASEGRGEGCVPRHIRGTAVGPPSS